ncbi:PAS domain S-box protein [Phenylobacterium sp.]|uniref:PAS domain S-box protein n=1 Tax=Phenylobacterium sp. TaxID=1871053 RepID=UPI0035AF7036
MPGALPFGLPSAALPRAAALSLAQMTALSTDKALAERSRFWEANFSSIPDFVYAFDRQRRFAYVNTAMLGLFGLSADEMIGKTFADLDYPPGLAEQLNRHIDLIFKEGVTVDDEVFFRSPTGQAAYFAFRWGPARAEDGSVELVVGMSRDTSTRRAIEEALRQSEARLRAATELVGVGIYSWDPQSGAFDWDERLRAMWGLPPGTEVDTAVFEAGIHPGDLPRVREAIAASVDPAGDGRYSIEYRVIGRGDGVTRHIATSGQTTFSQGRAASFIGAAIDLTALRQAQAAIQAREAQFRSFAEHSSNLLWIADPQTGDIEYRSPAYERIWGGPREQAARRLEDWYAHLHPDDVARVRRAMHAVESGEVAHVEYRIIRPCDGEVRWLRDTSFPIRDALGDVVRIGGIAEDLTRHDGKQVYIVGASPREERRLARLLRGAGFRARTFSKSDAFLDIAPFLGPGCVLVDLRHSTRDTAAITLELRARSIPLKAVLIGSGDGDVSVAVEAMKSGAADYLQPPFTDAALTTELAAVTADTRATPEPAATDEPAARLARLSAREREVLGGLIDGGTNKSIALQLGLSPRTVELHRGQIMAKLNAASLAELLHLALRAGLRPAHQRS